MIYLIIVLGLVAFLMILFLGISARKLRLGNQHIAFEVKDKVYKKVSPLGVVNTLSIMPVVDYHAENDQLRTEPGVAYYIQADDTHILMDVGFNQKKTHPSPLLHNMQALNLSAKELDFIFISHLHLDHVGGLKEQKQGTFSLSQGPVPLPEIPVYAPEPITPSKWNPGPQPEVIRSPKKLGEGIACLGDIPRNLFLMGYTLENSLVLNVAQKGLVLIVGCGHQTVERLIQVTKRVFDEPIYGVIGGLHFPVKGGRVMLGPLNMQNIVGSDRLPWQGIGEADVQRAIQILKDESIGFLSLSAHDSSDWSISQFKAQLGAVYHDLKVGTELVIRSEVISQ